jgi:membrane-bound serine protease (ClpP class)
VGNSAHRAVKSAGFENPVFYHCKTIALPSHRGYPKSMKSWLLILLSLFWTTLGWTAPKAGLIKINGAIGPATANYIARAIDLAGDSQYQCLVLQLDTPGGLLDSTKEIVEKFYASKVPVIVYVAPSGANAGSAGTFITLAADIAAMAPHTSIGAAHPVMSGGMGGEEKMDDVMKQKLENFATSYIEAIAVKRNRNIEWAKSAVKESASITAEKALELKVIDIISPSLPDLLNTLNGRKFGEYTLQTAGAEIIPINMSPREKVFQVLWRPEVMFILMLIAIYGIIGELSNPGSVLPGVVGAIALILVLYMSAILPINIAGVALIVLAIALFIIDVFAPTHGILTAGGIVSFFLGSLMLFDKAGPGFRLSLGLIVPATIITALFFALVLGAGLRAQFLPKKTGKESMLGQSAKALSAIDAKGGKVFVEGEYWNAVSETPIAAGQQVVITEIEGLTLKVKPKA